MQYAYYIVCLALFPQEMSVNVHVYGEIFVIVAQNVPIITVI